MTADPAARESAPLALSSVAAPRAAGFDVVDTLSGLARLVRRSPTLGGSVPVRVAQGCVPLLEGNAWGHAITLSRPIQLRRRLTGWTATLDGGDDLARMTRASVPLLLADATLRPGAWVKRLERGLVDTSKTISLFTGLFVRPRAGVRLRQSTLANRRSVLYTVGEAILDDASALCPVVLEIVPASGVDAFTLDGEIATLAALPAQVTFSRCSLADAPDVARAHVGFYDADYFATKKRGQVARTYRDHVVRCSRASDAAPTSARGTAAGGSVNVRVVDGGPSLVEPAAPARFHRATGPVDAPAGTAPDRLLVRNAVPFTATYDGYTLTVDHDRAALERYAAEVRDTWRRWLDASGTISHDGALLYLTKYFTPHPPGEPHFFVKPCALIASSAGTSTVIDGRPGAGYDVMRGVVHSDTFHAAPAVFQLWRPGETIAVARGAVLAELFAFPRELDDTEVVATAGGAGGSWT
jgi:hypothetical protein